MSKKEAIKLINKAFMAIEYTLDGRDASNWTTFVVVVRREEQNHRRLNSTGVPDGLTLAQATKLFVVRAIVAYLATTWKLDAKDFLHTQTSRYFAYAYAHKYETELLKALSAFDLDALRALDYAELNKP